MTQRTILEEIRYVRHAISEEIGHDPRRIAGYYANLQAELKARLVNRSGESTDAPGAPSILEVGQSVPAR